MDRRFRAHQWRRARHNYNDLCPPIGRRAAAALLWLSCSIALLRALASSHTRAQHRAASQRRSFLNAHHRTAQVFPVPPESDSDQEHEEAELELSLPECLEYEEDYESETETESEIQSETEFETEPETAPASEPETEPEDERGPAVPRGSTFDQSLTQRLYALKLQSGASSSRVQPTTQEPQGAGEGEEPKDQDPKDPEESEKKKKQRRCKPKKPSSRRDKSPESPSKRGPIPIRRV